MLRIYIRYLRLNDKVYYVVQYKALTLYPYTGVEKCSDSLEFYN